MIGQKKLSEIKDELRAAMYAEFDDPIRWLEQRMTAARKVDKSEANDLLSSLERLLAAGKKSGKRSKAKKKPKTAKTKRHNAA